MKLRFNLGALFFICEFFCYASEEARSTNKLQKYLDSAGVLTNTELEIRDNHDIKYGTHTSPKYKKHKLN